MVCSLRNRRKAPLFLALAILLMVCPGCPLSPDDDSGGGGEEVRLSRTTPQEAVQWVATVWSKKLYTEYEIILHDDFEFFPRNDDLQDFPWIQGTSWGRTVELSIADNMFDPNFAREGNDAVQSIDMVLTYASHRALDVPPNGTELTYTADVEVLVGPNDGWRSDTKFIFIVVPDSDEPGLYQVYQQKEVQPF